MGRFIWYWFLADCDARYNEAYWAYCNDWDRLMLMASKGGLNE